MAQRIKVENIMLPASASQAETVSGHIVFRNLTGEYQYVILNGYLDYVDLGSRDQFQLPEGGYYTLAPEQWLTQEIQFSMLGSNTVVYVWSWYWDFITQNWVSDDMFYWVVYLAGEPPPPPEEGRAGMVAKLLEYDGLSRNVPADNVPQGVSARLRVRVRNNTGSNQRLSVSWDIHDPDGVLVQQYIRSEEFWTTPGNTQDFVGPFMALSRVGNYSCQIGAYTPQDVDQGVPADLYDGRLGTTIFATGIRLISTHTPYDAYDKLDSVAYVLRYQYKGIAQSGSLKLELGIGTGASFVPEAVIGPVSHNFAQSQDWGEVSLNRTLIVPDTLQPGRAYNIRTTLTTADGLTATGFETSAFQVTPVLENKLDNVDFSVSYGSYNLGQTIAMHVSYRYQGEAQPGQMMIIIGKGIIFSPVYHYSPMTLAFAQADSLTTRTMDFNLTLPATLNPGQVYSIKVVMETSDGQSDSQTKGSQFEIAETEVPEDPGIGAWRTVRDYRYPAGDAYTGDAYGSIYEFGVTSEQLDEVGDWLSQKVIDEFDGQVRDEGAQMLHLTVKERDHGLDEKDFQITAWTTIPQGAAGQQYTSQGIVTLAYVRPALIGWVLVFASLLVAALAALGFYQYQRAQEKKWDAVVEWGPGAIPEEPETDWGDLMGNMGALLMLGIMVPVLGMVSEQAREMGLKPGEPRPAKPYTEAMIKAARTAVKTAEKGVSKIAGEISHLQQKKKKADEIEREKLAEREREKKLKMEEAKEELRKKRDERDRMERANR